MLHIVIKNGIIKGGKTIMKKTFFTVLLIIFIIICITYIFLINLRAEKLETQKSNMQYEYYLNKKILGTELATLISKVVDQNEKNNIQKDEKGYYINNEENSIKIDLQMTTIEKTYPMEEIYNNKITSFVENFNYISFKCTNIEYHIKTGKVSKLIFEELE